MDQQNFEEQNKQVVSTSETKKGPKTTFIVIGEAVVLVLAVLAILYFYFDVGKSPAVVIEEDRVDLIERINEADTKPLTEDEKIKILEKYGGDKTVKYNFTDEQKEKILKALNGN